MKIIVLHGDDERKIYGRLQKFVDVARIRSWEVVNIEDTALFRENISSASLFGGERFFILKDASKLVKKDFEWIRKNEPNLSGNLIIYNEGYIAKKILDSLPKDAKVEEFKLPKLIFNFLETLIPGNSQKSLKLLHQIIERDAPEMVFMLIVRQFRDLYWAKVDADSMPYPDWRILKLKSQSSKFSGDLLKGIINKLAEIDIEVKTSKAEIVSSLDLLMVKQLK